MKKGLISILILLLIVVPLMIKGSMYFSMFILILGVLSFKELFDLKLKQKKLSLLIEVFAYLSLGFLILNNFKSNELTISLDYRILTFMIFAFLVPLVIIADNKKYNLQDALYLFGSIVFIGLSFNLMIILRNYSISYFVYLVLISLFTDGFSLITGKLIGKHKLKKEVSPNKTVEGFIGGTIMGTIIGIIFYLTVINSNVDITYLVIASLTLSVMGSIGDLIFSQIKRFYEKKDFSNYIPGHGGFLDIFDGFIFTVVTSILFIGII